MRHENENPALQHPKQDVLPYYVVNVTSAVKIKDTVLNFDLL